ncbi:MAG: hypothetical protein J5580_02645 [Clostridia bacterium]|nr:hypothetical protein [Clostridia bacterium]
MILKMLWSPRKYLNTQGANETIFKGLIKFIYKTFEWVLLICSLLLLVYIPAQFIFSSLKIVEWWVDVLYVCGAFCGILISRVFRILAIDIERTKDKNFMITLLSVIIALISIVIVIVK